MRAISVASYTTLLNKVRETLVLGQKKIEEAKVKTYWETGRLIGRHILQNKGRADYGERVMERLSADLDIDLSVLKRIRRFYDLFPKGAARHLSWAHYRALITVPDEKNRLALEDQAANGEWSSRDLEIKVRNLLWDERVEASEGKKPGLLPAPELGPFFTFRILDPQTVQPKEEGLLLLDLGFSSYRDLDAITSKVFKPFDIVGSVKTGDDKYALKPFSPQNSALSPQGLLYTYKATIEKVVDGDTLRVIVDLGFNVRTRQYIRLKGIDCPEVDTKEGVAAKKFVEHTLQGLPSITLKTIKSDKYDRHLADVFFTDKTDQEVYLNNLLLEKGFAVKVK